MRKRIFLFLTLAVIIGSGVSAQVNYVSGEVSLLGLGARYERGVADNITFNVNAFWNFMPTPFLDEKFSTSHHITGVNIAGRWYPIGPSFFGELGLGYNVFVTNLIAEDTDWYGNTTAKRDVSFTYSGFTVTPGFGWYLDVGTPGGFFVSPGIKVPLIFTGVDFDIMGLGGIVITGVIYLGIGYAF